MIQGFLLDIFEQKRMQPLRRPTSNLLHVPRQKSRYKLRWRNPCKHTHIRKARESTQEDWLPGLIATPALVREVFIRLSRDQGPADPALGIQRRLDGRERLREVSLNIRTPLPGRAQLQPRRAHTTEAPSEVQQGDDRSGKLGASRDALLNDQKDIEYAADEVLAEDGEGT